MLRINDQVHISTTAGGCYHNKTGRIVDILNRDRNSVQALPQYDKDNQPYWYRVNLNTPADNGSRKIFQDIFLTEELQKIEEE